MSKGNSAGSERAQARGRDGGVVHVDRAHVRRQAVRPVAETERHLRLRSLAQAWLLHRELAVDPQAQLAAVGRCIGEIKLQMHPFTGWHGNSAEVGVLLLQVVVYVRVEQSVVFVA